MSTEDNKAVSRRFYEEVINQKQLAVINEVAGDNYLSHDFPPGLPPGREGLKIFISVFHAAFPDGHLTIDQMIAEGDTVPTPASFKASRQPARKSPSRPWTWLASRVVNSWSIGGVRTR